MPEGLSGPCVLRHRDPGCARALVHLQRSAYRVEADLIGSDSIPQLHETADDVTKLELTFLGFVDGGAPVAALGYHVLGDVLDVDRLVVDPRWFRRGLAPRLVLAALGQGPLPAGGRFDGDSEHARP